MSEPTREQLLKENAELKAELAEQVTHAHDLFETVKARQTEFNEAIAQRDAARAAHVDRDQD